MSRTIRRNPRRKVRDIPVQSIYIDSSTLNLTDDEDSGSELHDSTVIPKPTTPRRKGNKQEKTHLTIEKHPSKSVSNKICNTTKPIHKCNANDLRVGDFVSRISYCQVTKKNPNKVWVKNESGYEWGISNSVIEKEMFTAGHYSRVEKQTMTQLAETLMNARNAAFTVCFERKLTPDYVEKVIAKNSDSTPKEISKLVLHGKTRILIGKLESVEEKLGRSRVIDLECNEFRLVDHRTIKWIVYQNVKYELK